MDSSLPYRASGYHVEFQDRTLMTPTVVEEQLKDVYSERIDAIERLVLRGRRPRSIGYNARIGEHGPRLSDPVVRLRTAGGGWGIGWSELTQEDAQELIGRPISDLFRMPNGSTQAGFQIDLPLWDLVARLLGLPLFRLLGARGSRQVPVYDASIYIDDLELDDAHARELFTQEVRSGQAHGYHHFKVKVGRGARWMAPTAGLDRDALVVAAVREAAGEQAHVMIDANMGNTFNSACDLLLACSEADIYWFEEPFAEDAPLNQALKEFIEENGLRTLIADGEFAPPPYFFDLIEQGWIDIAQQDFHIYGLTWWRDMAARVEACAGRCAPHTWGSYIDRYPHAHFAASIANYELLEAAPAEVPGLVDDGWALVDGCLIVPETPGCGFDVDAKIFEQALLTGDAWRVTANT